jgi:hypothetical protein
MYINILIHEYAYIYVYMYIYIDLGVKKAPQILRGAEDHLKDTNITSFKNTGYIFLGFLGIFLLYKGYINRSRILTNGRKKKQSV